jgi:hypothetical protein
MPFRTTGGHQIHSDRCCVLFHPKSGAIRHVHRVITYAGAEETPAAEMERIARGMVREAGGDVHSLIVESQEFAESGSYKVDPRARRILRVVKKKPSRPRHRPAAKIGTQATPKSSAKRRR